jgi:predicted membrane protein|tara:strand:- start:7052 stop:7507 length:456 start_codon:yes stop_codon:yes gene_type:complete
MKFFNPKSVKSLDLKTLKSLKIHEIIFIVLMLLYIVSGFQLSYYLGNNVNNIFTYIALVVFSVILFKTSNNLVAILFIITLIVFFMRNKVISDLNIIPSESNKEKTLKVLNQDNGKTLEEEMVDNIVKPTEILSKANYEPVLTKTTNVTSL